MGAGRTKALPVHQQLPPASSAQNSRPDASRLRPSWHLHFCTVWTLNLPPTTADPELFSPGHSLLQVHSSQSSELPSTPSPATTVQSSRNCSCLTEHRPKELGTDLEGPTLAGRPSTRPVTRLGQTVRESSQHSNANTKGPSEVHQESGSAPCHPRPPAAHLCSLHPDPTCHLPR